MHLCMYVCDADAQHSTTHRVQYNTFQIFDMHIHYSAKKCGTLSFVKVITKLKYTLNFAWKFGRSPLHRLLPSQ